MSKDYSWNKMLEDFRKLGGVADNIEQRSGPFGNGIFPSDPARPIRIAIPPDLLVDTDQLILEGEDLVVAPDADLSADAQEFIRKYQKHFSWGAEGRSSVEDFENALKTLPAPLLQRLRQLRLLHLGARHKGDWNAVLRERFLHSRRIFYHGRKVSMPIIELINHSAKAATYQVGKGIAYQGKFDGEVLVNYSASTDALRRFLGYGFAYPEPNAFSMQVSMRLNNTRMLNVSVDTNNMVMEKKLPFPKLLEQSDDNITLSHLRLGMESAPRMPRSIFRKILSDQPTEIVDETFDRIRNVNQLELCNLLELSEGVDTPVVREFRRAVIFQLRALSYCHGARVI